MNFYIFDRYVSDGTQQVAIRPSHINQIVSHPLEDGTECSVIFFSMNRDGNENSVVVKHSVKEVVDALNRYEGMY